jgi:signal transduction histidine kinase
MERVSAGESVRVEYRIDTEGGEKWVESRADAIAEDGDVVRVVGFTRDITDRKRTERELATKNDQLERFASMVAHDLRNPWSVADGYLDLARADHDSDELATVADALDRMERIITDLLELARAGAAVGERETVSLAAAAETTWAAVDHADATLRVDADDVTLLADPSRLAQVFENLYRNALEHGERGVTVTVGTFDDGFYVADDGPGIPDADREAVFESGYSTRETGTGFGLAIVREVTNAHGWTVRAVPGAEGGARFEFSDVEWA